MFPIPFISYCGVLLRSPTYSYKLLIEVKSSKSALQEYTQINRDGSLPPSILVSGVHRQGLYSYSCREFMLPAFTKWLHFISKNSSGRKVILSVTKVGFQLKILQ